MGKVFYGICLLGIFATIFITGSCSTDDYVINANGIQSDSSTIYIAYTGNQNYLTVSSYWDWGSELENPDQGRWLTFTPDSGDYTTQVRLSAPENEWRRRSTRIIFHNEYMTDTVTVIQRANAYYEPGTVLYNENFGAKIVSAPTDISSFSDWGAYGKGISVRDYTGSGALIQSKVMSEDYNKQPHEVVSSENNLELEPGGVINLPQLSKNNIDSVILTLYTAAYAANSYMAMDPNSLYIEGSTDKTEYTRIPLTIASATGWQKVESEFRIQTEATNFFMRIGNSGSQTIYIDDITLESGGKGTQTIGRPTPIVTTLEATDIDAVSATLRGSYTLPGSIAFVDKVGIQWRPDEGNEFTRIDITGHEPGEVFGTDLTELKPGTKYHFQVFTVHDNITTYGNILSFTTLEAGTGGR